MATTFLTSLTEQEFKAFLKEALWEILSEQPPKTADTLPDILDIKQAAAFLKLKLTTLYEKTSLKLIPHFKKGNRLYFNLADLRRWIIEGKVKTAKEIEAEATTFTLTSKR